MNNKWFGVVEKWALVWFGGPSACLELTQLPDLSISMYWKVGDRYASAAWDPHHQNHIQNLEKIQKRAARYVTDNYTMKNGNSKFNLDRNFRLGHTRRTETSD